ncbi:MAG TPA: metallophosphoesterase family protein [Polyangiaceae bacterium]|nr:metallophosphoesterase family protein [Polyangiaceae bacterium]
MIEPYGGASAREIFDFLTGEGEEWSHKVGVAGRVDGSGKSSTRLLAVDGWVLKTDLTMGARSWDAAEAGHYPDRSLGFGARVWHPKKSWAVFRSGETYYPLTVCPRLFTLRSLAEVEVRLSSWLEMLRLALRVGRDTGIGLDLNPANFGREGHAGSLYYLDDEFYARCSEQQLSGAIAARIPEEPDIPDSRWRQWGAELGALLVPESSFDFARLIDGVRDYPLTEQFYARRAALIEGMRSMSRETWRPNSGHARELVCVFGDVHANLPALEAVLAEAERLGATRHLFLGDVVGYGPHPKECVTRVAELPRVTLVKGNHDHGIGTGLLDGGMNSLARACGQWTIAQLSQTERDWLSALPLERREGDFLAVHGAPRDPSRLLAYVYELTFEDNLRWLIDHEIRVCFHGHSHVQTSYAELPAGPRRLPGELDAGPGSARAFLINPGSVGQPRDGDPRAAFGLFDPRHASWTPLRVAYPVERTLRDLARHELPSEAGRRLLAGA